MSYDEPQAVPWDRLKIVVMAGRPDFGRCPLATRLNRALWPMGDKPVLQWLLENLTDQGARRFVITGSEDIPQIRDRLSIPPQAKVEFRRERLPRGSAGCILDAAEKEQDDLILVLPATLTCLPDLRELIGDHRRRNSPLTIFFNPPFEPCREGLREAQIYACQPLVLKYIPAAGYCDLKEGLVPKLVQAGLPVAAAGLKEHAGSYTNWNEYVAAVSRSLLRNASTPAGRQEPQGQAASEAVVAAADARIDPTAKVVGPVLIGDHSVIEANAIICGPVMIGKGVQIGADAVVSESVLWDNARVGPRCHLQDCLVDSGRVVPPETEAKGRQFPRPNSVFGRVGNGLRKIASSFFSARSASAFNFHEIFFSSPCKTFIWIGFLVLSVTLVLSYLNPTFIDLARTWSSSDEYSSGMLVPLLAVYILWHRRRDWMRSPVKPLLAAMLILAGAQAMRLFGLLYYYDTLDRFSFLFTVAALVVLILGLPVFKKLLTVWLFCFLMFPLPARFERWIAFPLQKWATVSAVYVLETLGYNVVREGNLININGTLVAVAEACNGLRMLTAFFVVSGFVVLITERALWQKVLLLLSSVPIALLCNTLRLTITSVAFTVLDTDVWEQRFHDFGGLAMMPLALGIIMLELWFFSHLFLSPTEPSTAPLVIEKRNNSVKDGTFSGST